MMNRREHHRAYLRSNSGLKHTNVNIQIFQILAEPDQTLAWSDARLFALQFRTEFATNRLQSMRIGCLHALVKSALHTDDRIRCHLRWSSPQMLAYYNRGNDYRVGQHAGVRFIP